MAARAYIGGGDPVTRCGGDRPFFSRDLVANLKKKITLRACGPMGGRPGGIFEIFQNRHIFLIFLFFKNIKKKKAPSRAGRASSHQRDLPRVSFYQIATESVSLFANGPGNGMGQVLQ